MVRKGLNWSISLIRKDELVGVACRQGGVTNFRRREDCRPCLLIISTDEDILAYSTWLRTLLRRQLETTIVPFIHHC
jgi:hypothetical protein